MVCDIIYFHSVFGTTQRRTLVGHKNSLRGLSWCKLKKDIVNSSPNKFHFFAFFQGACVKYHFFGVNFTFLQGACVQRATCILQLAKYALFAGPRFGQNRGKGSHFFALLQKAAFSGKAKALFLGAFLAIFWPKRAIFGLFFGPKKAFVSLGRPTDKGLFLALF